MGPIHCPGVCH